MVRLIVFSEVAVPVVFIEYKFFNIGSFLVRTLCYVRFVNIYFINTIQYLLGR